MSIRRMLNTLKQERAGVLNQAEAALNAGNQSDYKAHMTKIADLNSRIADCESMIEEQNRYDRQHAPVFGAGARDMEEMGRALRAREAVTLNLADFLPRMNSTLAGSGALVAPTVAGSEIRDGFGAQVSGLIDMVSAIDLTGLTGYEEPYEVSDMAAQDGSVSTTAGTTRTASDPTFAKAKLSPYEVTVTSYVDRNLAKLSNTRYADKVQTMALRALRRKTNALIVNGDATTAVDMFGIVNAKNSAGANIYATEAVGAKIDVGTLNQLVYAYGGSEELGGNARLLLTKKSLQSFTKLHSAGEQQPLFKARPDQGNANSGVLEGDGLIVPYTICSAVGDSKIIYGDPMNYLLGLFGQYTIRLSEEYKFGERMVTIAGDVLCGGNIVVDKGFVVGTIGA